MFAVDHVAIAGDGHEDIANRRRFTHRHHAEAIHHCFHCLDRIYFSDDDVRAHATRTQCDTLAAPSITNDDERATGEQNVCGADDAVESRLARAIAIVKEVFSLRVVYSDGREGQHTRSLHCLETLNAGGCFFS